MLYWSVELRLALISYQADHMLLLRLELRPNAGAHGDQCERLVLLCRERVLRGACLAPPASAFSHFFVAGLPHLMLIELRQALISYQDYHILMLTRSTPPSSIVHANLAAVCRHLAGLPRVCALSIHSFPRLFFASHRVHVDLQPDAACCGDL